MTKIKHNVQGQEGKGLLFYGICFSKSLYIFFLIKNVVKAILLKLYILDVKLVLTTVKMCQS